MRTILGIATLLVALVAAPPARAGSITTRQMATSSAAPAAVPGAGASGSSDAVARSDHSHACTAASASAPGCVSAADYQSFSGKVASVTGTAPIVSSGGATPAISCTAASASTGGCVTTGAQMLAGAKTFQDGVAVGADAGVSFGDGTTQTTASPAWDDLLKRRITWDRNGGNSTTFTSSSYGPPAPTAAGTATLVDDGSPDAWINYASAGTLGAQGGIKAYTLSRWSRRPILQARVRAVDTSGLRMFVVISSGELTNVTLDGLYGPGTSEFAGAAFDAAYAPTWQCCSGTGDPLEYGCTDTGVAVAADTEYRISVSVVPLTSTTCVINGTTVVRTGSPPDPALNRNVGFMLAFYTTVASIKNYQLNRFSLETY